MPRSSAGDLRVVGVVASTGGPGALQAFLGQIPSEAPLCLLVVQHMSAGFLPFFARTLDRDCPLTVSLAHAGARVRAGQVWLAPGDQHLRLEADRTLSLGPPEGKEPHVPSGDVLLRSLAEVEGEAGVAVVLSGMGEDGARGAQAVAQAGGLVLAQDEKTRVGVLALFGTPIRRELGDVERSMRSILAQAITAPSCQLRDPVTGLYTEAHLKHELERNISLFDLTKGKLMGGLVVGMVDTLKLYKQTLETSARIDPGKVSQAVSGVLTGVGSAILRRCSEHTLDVGSDYKGGIPGRIGHDGFGVILPLLQPGELCMWAVHLSKEVIKTRFPGEDLLDSGDITVSLRVIPFAKGTWQDLWGLATRALEDIEKSQLKARRDEDALRQSVNQIRVFHGGRWVTTREFANRLG